MDNREEADAAEPAGKKGTRWWVVVLVIVLIVVVGLCLWVLVGPAIVSVLSG
jgi:flagellar basal body-associated protein FliL